jgi:hypothetical protein
MKRITLRSAALLACAAGLAACGGGNANLLLAGSIIGLTKPGLVLDSGSGDTVTVSAFASNFAFPKLLESDADFHVTVKTQPTAAVCSVTNGKGTMGAYNVTSVIVNCVTNTYTLSGTVTGLDSAGLVINNGPEQVAIASGATSFTFTKLKADGTYDSGKVADGAAYGVTVFQQPAGRTCTVVNGVGTMGSADINTVKIQCA